MRNGNEQPDGGECPEPPVSAAASRASQNAADRQLYETYRGVVYTFILGLVKSRETAEEILQQTFMDYLKAPRPHVQSQKAYLLAIAHNLCARRAAPRKRDALVYVDFGNDSLSSPEVQGIGVEPMPGHEQLIDLESVLRTLPKRLQYVLELSVFHGLSGTEVAKRCGVSTATANRYLLEARDQLAISLGRKLPRRECK
jgi:RNA polymerase sigma factor (sigma-70 family)